MGASCLKNADTLTGLWELSVPALFPAPNILWREATIKIQKARVWRPPRLVNTWGFGECGAPGEGLEALRPFPIPYPMHLSYLAVLIFSLP